MPVHVATVEEIERAHREAVQCAKEKHRPNWDTPELRIWALLGNLLPEPPVGRPRS